MKRCFARSQAIILRQHRLSYVSTWRQLLKANAKSKPWMDNLFKNDMCLIFALIAIATKVYLFCPLLSIWGQPCGTMKDVTLMWRKQRFIKNIDFYSPNCNNSTTGRPVLDIIYSRKCLLFIGPLDY